MGRRRLIGGYEEEGIGVLSFRLFLLVCLVLRHFFDRLGLEKEREYGVNLCSQFPVGV